MFPIPLPWLIVGALVSLFGTYQVGHHYGWLERDNDMKIAIAKKNDEARQIEQNMTEKLSQQSAKLQEANDAINKKTTALAVANRAGKLRLCPSSNVQAPTSAPLPPQIQKQPVNLTDRLMNLLMPKEQQSMPSQK